MSQVEFISTYQGITYKVPESDKYARFKGGRLATNDDQVISYLREHPDYGVTLTEVEHPGKSIIVDVCICDTCGKVFQTKRQLLAHKINCKGKGENEEVV